MGFKQPSGWALEASYCRRSRHAQLFWLGPLTLNRPRDGPTGPLSPGPSAAFHLDGLLPCSISSPLQLPRTSRTQCEASNNPASLCLPTRLLSNQPRREALRLAARPKTSRLRSFLWRSLAALPASHGETTLRAAAYCPRRRCQTSRNPSKSHVPPARAPRHSHLHGRHAPRAPLLLAQS